MTSADRYLRRMISISFVLMIIANLLLPDQLSAEENKIVRVGWFDSSFCYYDQFGRRKGIDYEYQQKISAYTGWTYEYVEDSWSNLLQMLIEGEIDLLRDVSYTEERTKLMSFPDLPMGAEAYYIYIDAENKAISAQDLSSFNGKRIGVNKGSVQEGFLKNWAERNGLDIEIMPLTSDEDQSIAMLTLGEIDGFATIYSMGTEERIVPISRIGESNFYYAVNKRRPDLLAELNMALSGIQDEDPYFNQRISDEHHYNTTKSDIFLTPEQEEWLNDHGPVRIAYLDDYLPFCQKDPQSGELIGALKDYLVHASNSLHRADIEFETVSYQTVEEALQALKAKEVDCVFPLNLSTYDADLMDIRLTDPPMKTEMNVASRIDDELTLSADSTSSFAICEGDVNTETFVMDHYPNAERKKYADYENCFKAVSNKDADCVLVSNYRIYAAEEIFRKNRLFSMPTGESMLLSFAVNRSDRELYFILNKTAIMTDSQDMDAALASYMHLNQKVSFTEFLQDNMFGVIAAILVIFFIIIFLLLQRLQAERKVNEQQKLMEEVLRRELQQQEQLQSMTDMAYTDPLTGVKSKRAYNETEEKLNERIRKKEVSEFGIIIFDLNDLKMVNDSKGHESGDEYIKEACGLICKSFKHSPIFRVGGDEFLALLEGEDYRNRNELLSGFEQKILQNLYDEKSVVAFGSSIYDAKTDDNVRKVFERADEQMYLKKKELKKLQHN